jgi:hypothetical protein
MDGRITFRRKGQPPFNGKALPIFSVDSEEEAKSLMILACTLGYIPGVYGIPGFSGTLDGIPNAQQRLAERYAVIKSKNRGDG